jgi:UDP:flavonoid glycosyltransferase YjiC (YdhE family)
VEVEAVAADDLDVLVALGPAALEDFGDAPPNVRVERFVDQPKAVAAADLVVHHGGSGTLFAALAHGKRQVLLPKGADQFFNGEAAAAAGLADVLLPDNATPRGDRMQRRAA